MNTLKPHAFSKGFNRSYDSEALQYEIMLARVTKVSGERWKKTAVEKEETKQAISNHAGRNHKPDNRGVNFNTSTKQFVSPSDALIGLED